MSSAAPASSSVPPSAAHASKHYQKDVGNAFEGFAVLVVIALIRCSFLFPVIYYRWRERRAEARERAGSPAPPHERDVGDMPKLFDITLDAERGQLASWDAIVPLAAQEIVADAAPARSRTPLARSGHLFPWRRLRAAASRRSSAAPVAPSDSLPGPVEVAVAVAIAMPARPRAASEGALVPEYALGLVQLPVRVHDRAEPPVPV